MIIFSCAGLLGLPKRRVGSLGVGTHFSVSVSSLLLVPQHPGSSPAAGAFPLNSFDIGSCLVGSKRADEKGKKKV